MNDDKFQGKKIDPLDPEFNKPQGSNRFLRMNRDCEYYKVPCADCRKGYKYVSIYRGIYYEADETTEQKRKHKLVFAGVFIFAFAMFIISCILPYQYNKYWYVGIIESITLISFSFVLVKYIISLFTDSRMTEYVYKTTAVSLTRGCMFTLVMLVICLLGVVIGLVTIPEHNILLYLLGFLLFILSAAGMFLLWKIEINIQYKSWKSNESLETS